MKCPTNLSIAAVLLLVISAAGCGSPATPESPEVGQTAGQKYEDFDPGSFARPTQIDNEWLPMKPGMRYVYEGTTVEDDGTAVPHRIEIHVTDLTKVIGGIRTVVSWDLDYSDGQLVEAELAFFAQDNDGNVWRMGEYPEAYEDGKLVEAPAWIHGLDDARAGIMMKADPRPGTPSYSQGWGPAVGWTDRGQVHQVGQQACVPVDCYEDVLVIAESSESEPGALQLKYYARRVGNIRVDWKGADATKETLELVEVVQLSAEAVAEVRARAVQLERSAYQNSPGVYGNTSPVEYPVGQPAHTDVAAPTPRAGEAEGPQAEVVVYASELPPGALSEFEFWSDPASPGGRLVGTPNTGGELDPPPEDDPHVTFKVQVQSGVAYRCWIHMKVGEARGKSRANVLWVQFSGAVDEADQEVFRPDTGSYLTAEGPAREGWAWVECDRADSEAEPLVYFRSSGEVTVRLQAGMEGVGFDQFLLSSGRFLEHSPSEAVVDK